MLTSVWVEHLPLLERLSPSKRPLSPASDVTGHFHTPTLFNNMLFILQWTWVGHSHTVVVLWAIHREVFGNRALDTCRNAVQWEDCVLSVCTARYSLYLCTTEPCCCPKIRKTLQGTTLLQRVTHLFTTMNLHTLTYIKQSAHTPPRCCTCSPEITTSPPKTRTVQLGLLSQHFKNEAINCDLLFYRFNSLWAGIRK